MPRVNRIRVSNIKLDGGAKIIGDKIWEQNGFSTIFLLENGGGKTSIIQLLHQVVLPNHPIQGRSLKSIVEKGSTINVAVEWIPDSETQPMFVTGFTFNHHGVKKDKSSKPYTYFNYIVERDTENSLSLETLPFFREGSITTYAELHAFLKQDENTQVFSSNYTYQEALEQYGILASEWQNISKVNGAEAGVTAFFDKADKIGTLIERLLIPAFLDNLFSTAEERNAIINAFKVYKDRLLELPSLEKNLNDFEAVTNNADAIIDNSQRFSEIKKELANAQSYLTRLFHTVQQAKEQNTELLADLQQELRNIEDLKNELQWKIDSHKVHVYKLEEAETALRYKGIEEKKKKSENHIETLKGKVDEQKAAESYEEYQRYSEQASSLEAQLKTAELTAGGKMQELNNSLHLVSAGNHYLRSKKLEQEEMIINKILTLNQELESNGNIQSDTQTHLTKAKVDLGQINLFISQYDSELIEVRSELGDFSRGTIEESNEAVTAFKEQLQRNLEEKRGLLQGTEDQGKMLQTQIHNENSSQQSLIRKLEETEKLFEKFSNEEHQLRIEINSYLPISIRTNLFEQQEEIRAAVRRKKEALNQEIIQLSVTSEQLSQYQTQINQKGYHLHSEIEMVKNYLAARDLFVISGTEWLLQSNYSKEKKEEIFLKNPLLPFSLLIENDKVKKASGLLGKFKTELTVPVFFLTKQGLEEGEKQGKFSSIGTHAHFFQQFNVRFTNEEWNNWVVELEEQIAVIQEQIKVLRDKDREISELEHNLKRFWTDYSSNERQKLSSEIKATTEKEISVRGNISRLENLLEQIDEKKEMIKREIEEYQAEISKVVHIQSHVTSFIKRYAGISLEREKSVKLTGKIASLQKEEEELKAIGISIVKQLEKERNAKETTSAHVNDLQRDIRDYGLIKDVESKGIREEEYGNAKNYLIELQRNSSFEATQIALLRKSQQNFKDLKQKAKKQIIDLNFSLALFERGKILFQRYLLERYILELEEAEKLGNELNEKVSGVHTELIQIKTKHTTEIERVTNIHRNEPYEYAMNHIVEKQSFDTELETAINNASLKYRTLEETRILSEKFSHALTELNSYEEFFVAISDEDRLLNDDQWSKMQAMQTVHQARNKFNDMRDKLRDQEALVKTKIQKMHQEIVETGNMNLLSMSRDFTNVLESSKGDYDSMIVNFHSVLEAIEKFKESLELQRKQSEEGRNEIIEMMYDRAELLYKNMLELPRYSRIEEKDTSVPLFTIHWPKHDRLESQHKLRLFVDEVLDDLVVQQENGVSHEKLDHLFEEKVTDVSILNCYAELDHCVLKALKPRNVQLSDRKEYFRWDEISQWSNGEKHASRMAMFITLNTFIRKKRFAQENSWKFLIADNPFGEASADHVVKPMIELAKKTNTQLFCLTGIEDKRIQMEFDTVISNRYIEQRGKLFLHSESETKDRGEMESLFYSKQQVL